MQKIVSNSVLDTYFSEGVMSLHLKEGVAVARKGGGPGDWDVAYNEKEILSRDNMEGLIDDIMLECQSRDDGFLEVEKDHFRIIQLGVYRIVIVYPPLSDGLEMTVVRPLRFLTIEDYGLDEKVVDLLMDKSEGVLIAGAPGNGKTTFAQALLDAHVASGKITKTIESPRDLIVDDKVVQYSFSHGSHDDLRDILLLSRPDYAVYDEVRNAPDFYFFKDLRLTGIGLLGVIHATKPIDSVQRFLGHVEIGVIPQVVDTVVFIKKGQIDTIYRLTLTLKVPSGMQSDDLARPVVEVTNFNTGTVEHEIYTFGEQMIVMPIGELPENSRTSKIEQYAQDAISDKLDSLFDFDFMLSIRGGGSLDLYIPTKRKPSVIGSGGSNIQSLEKDIGMSISVKTFEDLPLHDEKFRINVHGKHKKAVISFESLSDQHIHLIIGDEIVPVKVNHKGAVTISKKHLVDKLQYSGCLLVNMSQIKK